MLYARNIYPLIGLFLVVFTLMVLGCSSPTNGQETNKVTSEQDITVSDEALKAELIAVMDAVKADWNAANYDGLKLHWDQRDEAPLYIAEESDIVMTNWAAIEKYWSGTDAWNEWIVIDYYNYHVKRVDETNAIITFDLRFDVKLNDRPKPIGGDNRGVVSLRKIDGSWKIYSWVEAPLAAITYMRKLYELNVRDNLPPQE